MMEKTKPNRQLAQELLARQLLFFQENGLPQNRPFGQSFESEVAQVGDVYLPIRRHREGLLSREGGSLTTVASRCVGLLRMLSRTFRDVSNLLSLPPADVLGTRLGASPGSLFSGIGKDEVGLSGSLRIIESRIPGITLM